MAEYIERGAAMLQIDAADFVRDDNFEGGATLLFCDDVVDRLSAIPAADVLEVKRGKWDDDGYGWVRCSICRGAIAVARGGNRFNFCPNCGADMREEQT